MANDSLRERAILWPVYVLHSSRDLSSQEKEKHLESKLTITILAAVVEVDHRWQASINKR